MCFELQRDKPIEKPSDKKDDKPKLGKPRGLKFDKPGSFCELFSVDEKLLIKWRDALRKIVN